MEKIYNKYIIETSLSKWLDGEWIWKKHIMSKISMAFIINKFYLFDSMKTSCINNYGHTFTTNYILFKTFMNDKEFEIECTKK